MLNSKFCEGNPPIIQINDIRYDIFQVRTFLKIEFYFTQLMQNLCHI